jgi:arylsulfatase A-like enzyme
MYRYIVLLTLVAMLSLSCSSGEGPRSGDTTFSAALTSPSESASTDSSSIDAAKLTTASTISGPNVLFITIDTLRADHLHSYGYTRISTPNLDRLAAEGARFSQAYSQFPQTNPSHASMFTGNYAATHGMRVHGLDQVLPTVPTLAEVLEGEGYNTGAVYSWPSFDPEFSNLDRGFRTYQKAYFPVPGKENEHIWRQMAGRADVTTDLALEWLSRAWAEPFFLWVHYQDPHYPFAPPPPYDTMYDPTCSNCLDGGYGTIDLVANGQRISDRDIEHVIALYDGAISFTDREIGRLVNGLQLAGLEDETIIIITGDHGESFGENNRWLHPFILYNTTLRVPLIMRYPPTIPQGTVVNSVVRSIDIMPTVLETLNVSPPRKMDGASLSPLISGRANQEQRASFAEVPDHTIISIVEGRWKLIRDNRYSYLELYDLLADPAELNNVAQAYPATTVELEQKLLAWMRSNGVAPDQLIETTN